jgi:hypothetical protein
MGCGIIATLEAADDGEEQLQPALSAALVDPVQSEDEDEDAEKKDSGFV